MAEEDEEEEEKEEEEDDDEEHGKRRLCAIESRRTAGSVAVGSNSSTV